ncbi:MAG: M12 family metallo-peptidase [Planctomycetota bacterium]|nr:M12 family metallo-peptidase [Planctomycetota bacterium]
MTSVGVSFADWCFSVVNYSCAVGSDVFAHELGHNMGSNHDRNNASSGAYSYSFGYRTPNNGLKTVMAYYPGAVTGRWSGPNVTYNGVTMGTSTEDNVRSINNTGTTVAAFRNGPAVQPPSPIALYVETMEANQWSIISVDNATPSDTIYLVYSLAGGGPTTTPYGVAYLSNPIKVLTSRTTNSSGFSSYAVLPPAFASGVSIWIQAYDVSSSTFSNSVYKYVF